MTETGPLLLGTSGRVGQALRRAGWPGLRPVWHARRGPAELTFDLLGDIPPLPPAQGVVVFAGVTSGTPEELALNTTLARAGIALARDRGLGRVLVISSAGVYGPAPGIRHEDDPLRPGTPYGAAKRDMEAAVADMGVTCLRVANVAGSDALFGSAARGAVRLDRFADGTGPSRSYIGPVTLARALTALLAHDGPLPPVLNLASPNPLDMADVLNAMGLPFDWQPAPPTALHRLALDTTALSRIVALPPLTAADLVAEARAGGWSPA
jgi:nucleoside-diphosphate-sugar epimerase